MSGRKLGVSLEPIGEGYVLRRIRREGKTASLRLSRDEAISLLQNIPVLRDRLSSARLESRQGTEVLAVPVNDIGLQPDALGEEILLTLGPPEGDAAIYVMTMETARELVQGLQQCFADVALRPQTKQ